MQHPYGHITLEKISPQLARLTLSHLRKRNAMTSAMWAALVQKLDDATKIEGLKALIITGDGDHFCAGADISEFEHSHANIDTSRKAASLICDGFDAVAKFPLPTLALIRGNCMGGGFGIASACDLRFADETAKFAIPPAKLGLIYPYENIGRMIDIIGLSTAKDWLLSARIIRAEDALKAGFLTQLHVAHDLEPKTLDYAAQYNGLSHDSITLMKEMFLSHQSTQSEESAAYFEKFVARFQSNAFKSAYRAFLSKSKS